MEVRRSLIRRLDSIVEPFEEQSEADGQRRRERGSEHQIAPVVAAAVGLRGISASSTMRAFAAVSSPEMPASFARWSRLS